MEEKISVIVPIYKVEQYLDRCVESLINQTYKNLEIILVDDGSPDNCPKMCDDYAKIDERIKVIHKPNGGLMDAWINGVNASTCEIISFVDSDDWCEHDMIEKLYRPMKEFDTDMSICNYFIAYESGKKVNQVLNYKGLIEGDNIVKLKKDITDQPNTVMPLFRWNKLFKKSMILDNLKYCDTRCTLYEDACIVQPCLYDAKSIYIVTDCLYNYFFRENSMIHEFNPKILEKCSIYFEMFEKILKDKTENIEAGLYYERIRLASIIGRKILTSKNKNKSQYLKELCDLPFIKSMNEETAIKVLSRNKLIIYKALKNKSIFKLKIVLWMSILKRKVLDN